MDYKMDYSYLNQCGFDTACSLPSMDPNGHGLSSCQLPCSYADLGNSCSMSQVQAAAASYRYGATTGPTALTPSRAFTSGPVPGSCGGMITGANRSRTGLEAHHGHQHSGSVGNGPGSAGSHSVFPNSMGLQSKFDHNFLWLLTPLKAKETFSCMLISPTLRKRLKR